MSNEAVAVDSEVSPEIKAGRNRLAVTVIIGHAVKHVFNSALPLLLAMMKADLALSALSLIHILTLPTNREV